MSINPSAILSVISDNAMAVEILQRQVQEKSELVERLSTENEDLKSDVQKFKSMLLALDPKALDSEPTPSQETPKSTES